MELIVNCELLMEFVSYGQVLNAFGEKKKSPFRFVDWLDLFAAGVYWPEGRHPNIPFFQHSIIPINCERSEPKFFLK